MHVFAKTKHVVLEVVYFTDMGSIPIASSLRLRGLDFEVLTTSTPGTASFFKELKSSEDCPAK